MALSYGTREPSSPVSAAHSHSSSSEMASPRSYPQVGSPSSASGICPGSPGSTRSLDDLLICPICLDEFKDPKTLSCLHSFCYKCLENCKRPYRRDISCPVCKKVTPLSSFGVGALQDDFRIQQIRDILLNRPNSPGTSVEEQACNQPGSEAASRLCDLCKSLTRKTTATSHCIQCFMYFCDGCCTKHNSNHLFSAHHVINMSDSHISDTLFCRSHKEHPVRYFCKPCSHMMCTICTMEHDPSHAPEPLEKGIIDKYRKQLHDSLRMVHCKLSEVKSHSKYLEIMKQTHQKSLHQAQSAIKEKTEEVIGKIREKEHLLLQELRQSVENKMKDQGVDNLGEINHIKGTMDALYSDIQKVIKGSPQDCLIGYEELVGRMKSVSDTALPSVQKKRRNGRVKFVPTSTNIDIVLGSLEECTISDSSDDELVASSPPAGSSHSAYAALLSGGAASPKPQLNMTRRVSSILNAISPSRKSEAKKIGKVKAFSTSAAESKAGPVSPSSPSTINADELVASAMTSTSASSIIPSPSSPVSDDGTRPTFNFTTNLVFKVDQVGGWPGRISSPSSVVFMPDGHLVVSECENRLQIFDRAGQSVRIMGWGKMKPQNVAINSAGHLLVTDKKDRCIKTFDANGDIVSLWGAGLFQNPSGIAISSAGNVIITDLEHNIVTIHNPDGTVITQFGSWGSGDYQFNNPTHVTVNAQDEVIVSDSGNSTIKVFDKNGVFIKKFNLQSSKQGLLRRPHGIATDNAGNILIADHDNHRISMFSSEGSFLRHILTKQDGIRYPTGLCLDRDNQHLAIVESHVGLLCKEPHHTVKLYQLQQQ